MHIKSFLHSLFLPCVNKVMWLFIEIHLTSIFTILLHTIYITQEILVVQYSIKLNLRKFILNYISHQKCNYILIRSLVDILNFIISQIKQDSPRNKFSFFYSIFRNLQFINNPRQKFGRKNRTKMCGLCDCLFSSLIISHLGNEIIYTTITSSKDVQMQHVSVLILEVPHNTMKIKRKKMSNVVMTTLFTLAW